MGAQGQRGDESRRHHPVHPDPGGTAAALAEDAAPRPPDDAARGGARARHRLGVGVWAGGQFLQQVLTLLTGILIARTLGSSDYGIVNILRNLGVLAVTLTPLGLDIALLKYLGRHAIDEPGVAAVVRQLRLLVLGLNVAIVALLALGGAGLVERWLYPLPNFRHLLLITALGLPFSADLVVMGAVARARGEIASYALLTLYLQSVLRVGLVVLAALYAPYVTAIVWINTAQVAVSGLAIQAREWLARRGDGLAVAGSRGGDVRAILSESVLMGLNVFIYASMRFVDVLTLGLYATPKTVGEYGALNTVSQLVHLYPFAASLTLGPQVSRHYHAGDLAGVRRALDDYLRFASIVAGFVFGGIAVFGDRLDLLFGASFHFRSDVAFLLPLGYLLSATLAPTGYALSMTGRHKAELVILASGGVLLVVLCNLLVPALEQVGAATAVVITFTMINVVRFAWVARALGFVPGRPADILPPLVALALASAARRAVDMIGERSLLLTIAACLLYAAAFSAAYLPALRRRWRGPLAT
ncbi:lipopolysaccharide biosynthesis protein [Methylobacterium sp. JK268]